jgi:hypothetical protein
MTPAVNIVEENRPEVNFELVERLAEREERDWTYFDRLRHDREKNPATESLPDFAGQSQVVQIQSEGFGNGSFSCVPETKRVAGATRR